MAKDLGKIKIEITEPKKPSAGVSGGGVGSSSGENRELSRMIGDSLKSSTIKIAGLAGLDGVAKTIISALSSFSRTIEKVTKTTGLQQAKTTDRALETSQKVTERIVKKPTEAYSPIGFRQPRPAPVGSIAKQLAPLYRKPTTIPAKGISPTSDFLNKLTWDVSKKVKPEDKVLSPPRPIAMSSVPPLSKPLEKLVQAQPAPVAQRLVERVRPALVAQGVVQGVRPTPIAQRVPPTPIEQGVQPTPVAPRVPPPPASQRIVDAMILQRVMRKAQPTPVAQIVPPPPVAQILPPTPVAQRLIERVQPPLPQPTPVAQRVQPVLPQPAPVAQRIVERVQPPIPQPAPVARIVPPMPVAQRLVERVQPSLPQPAPVARIVPPMPVAQRLVERVRPALRGVQRVGRRTALPTTVAQSVIQKVQPSPIAQSLMERVRPALPQPRGVTVPREAVPKLTRPLARSLQPSAVSRMVPIRPSGAGAGAAANTAAKTAMRGVGTTMATAARGIMVALRAALLNPITAIIAVVLAVVALAAVAIAKFVATIWKWSEDLMKTRDRLAAFSGALAASKASSNINQLFRDIRSARRLEKPLTAISSQRGRIKALWHPIADLLTVIKGIVVSAFLPIIEIFVGALGKAAAVVAAFVIAMKKPIKALAVVFRFLADILSKLSWVMPVGKAAVGTDIIATGLEGMLEGIENSNKALQDIFNELLNGNRQDASAAINADMASTASRLTGRGTDPSTGNLSKDYRWQPKFGGGSNP